MKIDPTTVKRVYVRDIGWIEVERLEETRMSITNDAEVNPRRMKAGWKLTELDGSELWVSAAMIEGVER